LAGESIKFYRSETANTAPTTLLEGELAFNLTDGIMYSKDSLGNIKQIANLAKWGRIVGNITTQPDLMHLVRQPIIQLHNGSGNTQTISTTAAPITLPVSTVFSITPNYSINASKDTITVGSSGIYKIYYKVGFKNTTNTRRSTTTQLLVNGAVVDEVHGYHRNKKNGGNTVSGTYLTTLQQNDTVSMQSNVDGTSGSLSTIDNTCSLIVERVDDIYD
jgi:hypothetical protein